MTKRLSIIVVVALFMQALVGPVANAYAEISEYNEYGEIVELTELEDVTGGASALLIGSLTGAAVGFSSYAIDALYEKSWNGTEAFASTLSGAITGTLIAATPISGGFVLQVAQGTLHGVAAHCGSRLVRLLGSNIGLW
ncbi:MAG: hypothetical protein ACOYD6_02295 [Limnochordia bacterium]|jgi:hypothetical protein